MDSFRSKLEKTRADIRKRKEKAAKVSKERKEYPKPSIGWFTFPESPASKRAQSWATIGGQIALSEMSDEPQRHAAVYPFYAYKDPLVLLDLTVAQFLYWFPRIRGPRVDNLAELYADPLGGTCFGSIKRRQATSIYRIRQHLDYTGMEWLPILHQHYQYMEDAAGEDARMPNQVLGAVRTPEKLAKMAENARRSATELPQVEDFFPVAATSRPDLFPALRTVWTRFREMVKDRKHWVNCETVIKRGMITPELAREYAGEKFWAERIRMDEDELLASGTPAPGRKRPEEIAIPPSCFACPGVDHNTNPVCTTCHFRRRCESEASRALKLIREKHGVSDPVREKKKEQARLRKRAQRERERASRAQGD